MSFAFLPPIMVNIDATEMTAATRQAAPIRQSNTNMSTIMATNIVAVPTISTKLCASNVSVSAEAP